MELIEKYFPNLEKEKYDKLAALKAIYEDWNTKINVISRKDMENFYERHVLHSLAISNIIQFDPNTEIMDIGTGGGFPGIPLAIMNPESSFLLVDSIGKKLKVVEEVKNALNLSNVTTQHIRAEDINQKFDFVISRAVTTLPEIAGWCKGKFKKNSTNSLKNGLIYLKGGDFGEEVVLLKRKVFVWDINTWFKEEFFETKKVVHIVF